MQRKIDMCCKKNISLAVICLVLAGFWINSTSWFRLKLADNYLKRGQFEKSVDTYRKILRKRGINEESDSIFSILNKRTENGVEKKIKSVVGKDTQSNLQKAVELYKQRKFEKALESYDRALFALTLLHPFLKDEIFEITDISRDEFYAPGMNSIYKLYKLALRAGDPNLDGLKGINLLWNPMLEDKNNDGKPDRYIFSRQKVGGILDSEIIDPPDTENNIYHVWQRDRAGWFATYFKLGRVPNNTYIVFSIETKYVEAIRHNSPQMFTTTKTNMWHSGTKFSNEILSEKIDDGWKKESYVLLTKETNEIFLKGWIASWQYAKGSGDIYVRNPKVEFGQEATLWTNYLK